MKIAIFGGTGKTGQHLVQQALEAGYEVVALARNPARLTPQHEKLTVIQGDALDSACVEETIRGVDAVMSLLGPNKNNPDFAISKATGHILEGMKRGNVRRIIIAAGAGVGDPQDKPKLIDHFFGFLLKVVSKRAVADMKQVASTIRASDRDWTIVRVPMLTDQPPHDTLTVGYLGDINARLARADMATFMLKQLKDDSFLSKAPAISN